RCYRIGRLGDTPGSETGCHVRRSLVPESRDKFVAAPEIRPLCAKNLRFFMILRAECKPPRQRNFGIRQGNGSGIAEEAARGPTGGFCGKKYNHPISLPSRLSRNAIGSRLLRG